MALHTTDSRGRRIAEPTTGNHPDEDHDDKVTCAYCGKTEVESDDETCPVCLAIQREREAENDDPGAHYADLQNDQDRLDGVQS
jgi:hypothetical protein